MKLKAIILAAGLGTRLSPRTKDTHKCLIKINGESIIRNAIRALSKCRVRQTVVVVGYRAENVRAELGNLSGGMTVTYVENPRYDQTNTSYSLWLALRDLSGPDALLVLEGDVFFQDELIEKLIRDPGMNLAVVEKQGPGLDGSVVELDPLNRVVDWWHVSQRPENFLVQDKFKTVNIYKFSHPFLVDILLPALQRSIQSTAGTDPLEYVMKDIVRNNASAVSAFMTQGLKWVEIDDENDLLRAESIFAA